MNFLISNLHTVCMLTLNWYIQHLAETGIEESQADWLIMIKFCSLRFMPNIKHANLGSWEFTWLAFEYLRKRNPELAVLHIATCYAIWKVILNRLCCGKKCPKKFRFCCTWIIVLFTWNVCRHLQPLHNKDKHCLLRFGKLLVVFTC